ncbi:MAG TPA: SGNH/GDSL hydrolase family protein [Acidimicrobiales bacterium]|nr:SGNH/GDSL hydrolase family protein [Acidimicrobiales bacterium]
MLSRGFAAHVLLGALAALGLSVVATSGIDSTRTASPSPTSGPRLDVMVVGESLTRQVAGLEAERLRQDGRRAAIVARDSEDLASPFVQAQVDQAVAEGVPIVVLETASNDAYHGAGTAPPAAWAGALDRYRETLDATLKRLAHQCTVLVDTRVDDTSPWYALGRIGPGVDDALAQAARTHPGSVELVRWSALSAGHGSDWFWSDGLHFGDPDHADRDWHAAGATAFAGAIASGVQRCAADRRG